MRPPVDLRSFDGAGHGAMTIALSHPDRFKACSAFAPIVNPMTAGWSRGAFERYLGADEGRSGAAIDACALVQDGARFPKFLIDQGTADGFLDEGLRPVALRGSVQRHRHRPDAQDAGRLRPFLLLHLLLHGRSPEMACAAPEWVIADAPFRLPEAGVAFGRV